MIRCLYSLLLPALLLITTGCAGWMASSRTDQPYNADLSDPHAADPEVHVAVANEWTAKIDRMWPGKPKLIVEGELEVPNPCYTGRLEPIEPRSTSDVFTLRVVLEEQPGMCAQVISTIDLKYTKKRYNGDHESALILLPDGHEFTVPIKTLH